MSNLPDGIEANRIITEIDPAAIKAAVEGLGTDEVLAIKTDLSRQDCNAIGEALGRGWPLWFRRDGDVIWMRSCKSALSVQIDERPLGYYVEMIERDEPFAFLRYGDMLACVTDTLYEGYGFQKFTPGLKADMLRTLVEYHRDPHYIMALAPVYHFKRLGLWGHVAHFLHDNDLDDIGWVCTEVFNRAMLKGELWPFVQALRNTDTFVVGPAKFAPLTETTLPDAALLVIPDRECYAQMDEMTDAILAHRPRPAVVTISAGPAAVVLIHRLWPVIGKSTTLISIGTAWAPFAGVAEHVDHRRITEETMRHNLGEESG